MKIKDFDFRIWNETNKSYEMYPALARIKIKRKVVVPATIPAISYYRKDKPFTICDLSGEECELELWSGFYDIKGKKIYEGDIVNCFDALHGKYDMYKGYICFEAGCFAINILELGYFRFPESMLSKEVIGNIHENPELIGGVK